MSRYFINEGAFDLPGGRARDTTIHVLALAGGARLLIDRAPLRDDAGLQDLAQERSQLEAQQHHKFTVLAEREGSLGGAPTLEIAAQYREEMDVVYERRVHFVRGRTAFTLTLRGPLQARADLDTRMDGVLETLRFRGEA